MEFDLAQTFFVDKDAVALADTCFITSVDLYFKTKPVAGKTTTGIYKPGVSVYVCPVDNDVPNLNAAFPEVARVEYDGIYESSTASTLTNFAFNYPIAIKTNQTYAVLVKFDGSDNDFKLWWNKSGEKVLNTTNVTQVSSGKVDGFFYTITNGKQLTALRDADLKFNLKIAKFTSLSSTFKLHNNSNEFIKFYSDSVTGNFKGGEVVWQNNAPSVGSVSVNTSSYAVVGNGTSFTSTLSVGDKFVVTDGTLGNADVRTVSSVANNTYLTVDVPFSYSNGAANYIKTPIGVVYDVNAMTDRLVLEDSTANSTLYFTSNSYVHGIDSLATVKIEAIEDYEVNYIRPSFNIFTPAGTSTNVAINIANSTYSKASTRQVPAENGQIKFIDSYPAVFASRSNEVLNGATLFDDSKSFETELTFSTTNVYTSPYAKEDNLDAFVTRYVINNDSTDEYKSSGNASTKYVSKRVVLADGQDAEDLRVYVSAYKPANTDVEVYAKFHNATDPDPFDDKNWTKLELVTDRNILSNPFNRNDVIEFEYKVPTYNSGTAVSGLFDNPGTGVITGTSGTVNTNISIGDVVRVYQPNFQNNHFIAVVSAANTTTFTVNDLTTGIANTSMISNGLKVEVVTQKNTAFENIQNNHIVRYFNASGASYDGYKTFAVKLVLLSSSDYRVPHVNDLRAIAVSA